METVLTNYLFLPICVVLRNRNKKKWPNPQKKLGCHSESWWLTQVIENRIHVSVSDTKFSELMCPHPHPNTEIKHKIDDPSDMYLVIAKIKHRTIIQRENKTGHMHACFTKKERIGKALLEIKLTLRGCHLCNSIAFHMWSFSHPFFLLNG